MRNTNWVTKNATEPKVVGISVSVFEVVVYYSTVKNKEGKGGPQNATL